MAKTKKNMTQNYIVIALVLIFLSVISAVLIKENNKSKNNNSTASQEDNITNSKESNKPVEQENDRFNGLTLINDDRGVPVLYYHSVDSSEANEVIISPDRLREQLQYIKDSGYTSLTMSELNDYIVNEKEIPEKSIVITFDDGYADNYTNAFPILKELDMKATIFVITSGIDKDDYYLTSNKIKEMSDYGIDIESHTVNHRNILNEKLTYDEQLEEFKNSKETLEKITGKPVLAIAYPFGDFNDNSIKAAKEAGYSLAFKTDLGYSNRADGALTLDRIYVSSRYSMDLFKNRLTNIQK